MNKLDEAEKREIVGRARTLRERFEVAPQTASPDVEESIDSYMDEWCENVAEGDDSRFQRRFDFEDLERSECRQRILPHDLPNDEPLPDWIHAIDDIISLSKERHSLKTGVEITDELPFVELLSPFVDYARSEVDVSRPSIISRSAERDLLEFLIDRLSRLVSHPLFIEFKAHMAEQDSDLVFGDDVEIEEGSREYYEQFVTELLDGGLKSFFLEYSFLARVLTDWIKDWVANVESIYKRLDNDWEALQETFSHGDDIGRVTSITALGDAHQEGRTVMKIDFSSGTTVAYKPRNLEAVSGFYELIEWVNENSDMEELRVLDIVTRDGYGWTEWVEVEHCTTTSGVEKYYQRAGMLMSIFFATEAVDLHLENVLSEGDQPVFIDLETVFQPLVEHEYRVINEAAKVGNDTVIRTGMLPRYIPSANVNHAAGFGGKQMEYEVKIREFTDTNTDRMELESVPRPPKEGDNLPVYDGDTVPPTDHPGAIAQGFTEMYRFIKENKEDILDDDGPIENLVRQDATIRALYRNTGQYTSILNKIRSPAYQRTGLKVGLEAEKLGKLFLTDQTGDDIWSVFEHELEVLQRFNTPRFTAKIDSPHLYDRGEIVVEDFFTEKPINLIRNRIRSFSEEDLSEQLEYIDKAYHGRSRSQMDTPRTENEQKLSKIVADFDTVAETTAKNVFDRIVSAARTEDGSPTWVLRKIEPNNGLDLHTIEDQLYDGRIGISVLAAALANTFGDEQYRAFAETVVAPVRTALDNGTFENRTSPIESPRPIGGGAGLGSIVYGLTKMGNMLNSDEYLQDAKRVSKLIDSDKIREDTEYDVLHGSAGAILGLLALHRETGDSEVLRQATEAGEHLLDSSTRKEGGRAWCSSSFDRPLCGFSHGVSGISYALFRLGQVTDTVQFTDAAGDGIVYEREHYDEKRQNWPDLRTHPDEQWMDAWCHGRTGVGFARLGMYEERKQTEFRQDVNRAIEGFDPSTVKGNDHLCCGNFGRAEFLLRAGQSLDTPQYGREAKRLIATSIVRAETNGQFSTLWQNDHWYNPGLLSGEAGIGYSLLKCINPSLPSILLFE